MNLLSSYEQFKQLYPVGGALSVLRMAGYEYATQKGLPTRKDEDWHYTSVKSLEDKGFIFLTPQGQGIPHETLVNVKKLLNPSFTNMVFVNGQFNATLSDELPAGLKLQEWSAETSHFDDAFEALNSAYLVQPYVLAVEKEVSIEKPVNFLFYSTQTTSQPLMVHPRFSVKVGPRSSVRLMESYYCDENATNFTNSVFDLHVGESAKVTYVRVQGEGEKAFNIGRTRIIVEKNATLESLAFATGSQLSRHSLDVSLVGPGSHSEILGIYSVQGTQHVDNTTLINHVVGDCNTYQLYKGILDGESKAAFAGRVLIQKGAQKANSSQLNNNLLLSSRAEADSKPGLDIYADDVKAAHGSTVGQLNKEELFYLQSRAIPKEQAIPMLSYGFLSEVVYKISDESIQHWLAQHLDVAFRRLTVGK